MTDKPTEKTPELADNALQKQPARGRGPGRPFPPGESGNPAGRPPGSKNRFSTAFQDVVGEQFENLLRVVLEQALDGDLRAVKLLLSHTPPEREQIELQLPKISSMKDIVAANEAVFDAIGQGQLAPESAKLIGELIASQMRTIGGLDFERRLALLEAKYTEADALKSGGKS
jgi:hypothetical protein